MKLGSNYYFINQSNGKIYKGKLLEHSIETQSGYDMCYILFKGQAYRIESSLVFSKYKDAFVKRKNIIEFIRKAKDFRKYAEKESKRILEEKRRLLEPLNIESIQLEKNTRILIDELREKVIGLPKFKDFK